MRLEPLPPVAAVVSFIDAINRADIGRLDDLITDDHRLVVFDESPLEGRAANVEAWRGYFTSFPSYIIAPHQVVERDGEVAVMGHTTGSHLGLPDDVEKQVLLIWRARVVGGKLRYWRLLDDTPANRESSGLSS
jgi:ketosteroid isomerase-like protein